MPQFLSQVSDFRKFFHFDTLYQLPPPDKICFYKCSSVSIFQAHFEAGFMKNLSIFELQIQKHYAFKKHMYSIKYEIMICLHVSFIKYAIYKLYKGCIVDTTNI